MFQCTEPISKNEAKFIKHKDGMVYTVNCEIKFCLEIFLSGLETFLFQRWTSQMDSISYFIQKQWFKKAGAKPYTNLKYAQ